ncbi:MAG: DUF1275 domain-containing protein [Bifidobacterium sp.]|jgi:uncharacterized membrane protein YoaK (UPF0700 family)|nr:DUF1275 domain-containing protein [Bifidobacterium sp.]MCI1864488.1 DUF1275 domain-containing protein [Bifidobacterium sp.]
MAYQATSEKTAFGALLTMAAGGIDAYSYLAHGSVFSGLQTGNLILLGISIGRMQWMQTVRYLVSVAAFAAGTIAVRLIQKTDFFEKRTVVRQRCVLLYEMAILLVVATANDDMPSFATTILLSLVAAAELQEFRRLNNAPFTPLMMTGNVRTISESLHDWVRYGNLAARTRFARTCMVLAGFVCGAILVALLIPRAGSACVLVPFLALSIAQMTLLGKERGRSRPHMETGKDSGIHA